MRRVSSHPCMVSGCVASMALTFLGSRTITSVLSTFAVALCYYTKGILSCSHFPHHGRLFPHRSITHRWTKKRCLILEAVITGFYRHFCTLDRRKTMVVLTRKGMGSSIIGAIRSWCGFTSVTNVNVSVKKMLPTRSTPGMDVLVPDGRAARSRTALNRIAPRVSLPVGKKMRTKSVPWVR